MNLLEVKNLRKNYGKLEVLKGIDITVNEGEVVSVIGPSGSGKSTFLRCAAMLEKIDGGSISYNGEYAVKTTEPGYPEYAPADELKKIKSYFSMVFQNFNLFPHYTVLKNITDAPVCVLKQNREGAEKNAFKLLETVGLSGKDKSYPCELSGGQQQRVAIARALAMNPKMIYFDEPTSALDPEITAGVLKILKQLANEKKTMLIVTHEIAFARNISDRVIFMDGGHIIEEGTPEQVIDNPQNERTRQFLKTLNTAD
ncbi:MAG: amino acid ABC transporter ATP-binding protein [Oscillospiraceae bacterium]|nr:amino acid ABC transporter ATP-binding protein [Oscillospiraceae bacterium]